MNYYHPIYNPYENTVKENRAITFGIQSSEVREPLGTSRMEDEKWRQDVIEMLKEAQVMLQDFRRETKVIFHEFREKSNHIVDALPSKPNQHSGDIQSHSLFNSSVEAPVDLMEDEVSFQTEEAKLFDEMSETDSVESGVKKIMPESRIEEVMLSDELSEKLNMECEIGKVFEFSIRKEVTKFDDLDKFSKVFWLDEFTEEHESVRNVSKMMEIGEHLLELCNEENEMLKLPSEKESFEIADIINCGDKNGLKTVETHLHCQVYHSVMENDLDVKVISIALSSPAAGIFATFDPKNLLSNLILLPALSVFENSNLVRDVLMEEMLLPLPELPPGIYFEFIRLAFEDSLVKSPTLTTVYKILENEFLVMSTIYSKHKMLTSAEDDWLKMLHQPPEIALASDSSITMQSNIMQPVEIVLKSTIFSDIPTTFMPSKGLSIEQEYLSFELNAILTTQTKWINEVLISYDGHHVNIKILTSQFMENQFYYNYSITTSIIKVKGRVYMGKGSDLRLKIIQGLHNSVCGVVKNVNDWSYFNTGLVLIKSSCSVESVEADWTTLLSIFRDLNYFGFNAVDDHFDMELDENDPITRSKLEGAADEYIPNKSTPFKNLIERLLESMLDEKVLDSLRAQPLFKTKERIELISFLERVSLVFYNFCVCHICSPRTEFGASDAFYSDSVAFSYDLADQILGGLNYCRLDAIRFTGVMASGRIHTLFDMRYWEQILGLLVAPLCKASVWKGWLYNEEVQGSSEVIHQESMIVQAGRRLLGERLSTMRFHQAVDSETKEKWDHSMYISDDSTGNNSSLDPWGQGSSRAGGNVMTRESEKTEIKGWGAKRVRKRSWGRRLLCYCIADGEMKSCSVMLLMPFWFKGNGPGIILIILEVQPSK